MQCVVEEKKKDFSTGINHDDIRDNMLAVILSKKRKKRENALMYVPFAETIICTRYCICFRGTPVISLKKDV